MKNFKDGGFRGGRKDYNNRPKFGGGQGSRNNDRGGNFGAPREMFQTTCSVCNKSCEVPFRPSGDKPVYCSSCFKQKSDDTHNDERSHDRGRNEQRPEGASFNRPNQVENSASNFELVAIKRQLTTIEARLNRILDIINPPQPAVKVTKSEVKVVAREEVKATLPVEKKKSKTKAVKPAMTVKKVVKKITKPVAKKGSSKATKKANKKTTK